MSESRTFTVEARGTAAGARPYTMVVTTDEAGITIDGMRLSWNSARAAFDSMIESEVVREFFVRNQRGRKR